MNDLPLWAAIIVSVLLVLGAGLAMTGSLGLLRMRIFYQRLHAPSLASSGATTCIVLASVIASSIGSNSLVLHDLLIGFFIMCTMPVTLMLLGRAALYRDRAEDRPVVAPTDPLTVPPRQD